METALSARRVTLYLLRLNPPAGLTASAFAAAVAAFTPSAPGEPTTDAISAAMSLQRIDLKRNLISA